MSEHLHVHHDHGVTWITIDRPDRKNAFLPDMIARLTEIGKSLADDDRCRIVVIRHAGMDFCSGADMGSLTEATMQSAEQRSSSFDQGLSTQIQPLLRAFLALRQPIVVSARGHAIGLGVQFLLFADLIVASETVKIMVPQVRLGHVLDHGESFLLPRRIGYSKAMELALLGEMMNAVDAERFGLINFLVRDQHLEAKTDEIVAKLLRMSPTALWRSKALMRDAESSDLEAQLSAERRHASACAGTDHYIEAITAFVEKREPRFHQRSRF